MWLLLIFFLTFPLSESKRAAKVEEVDTVLVQEIDESGIYFSEILWGVNWKSAQIEDSVGKVLRREDLIRMVPFQAEVWITEEKTPIITSIRVLGVAPLRTEEPGENRAR